MKRYRWLVLFLLLGSCSDPSKFRIEGIVENAKQANIYLDEQGVEAILPVDSVKINKNGSFKFKGENDYPKFYNLLSYFNNHSILDKNLFLTLIILSQ